LFLSKLRGHWQRVRRVGNRHDSDNDFFFDLWSNRDHRRSQPGSGNRNDADNLGVGGIEHGPGKQSGHGKR
jgi:hypothetical protein